MIMLIGFFAVGAATLVVVLDVGVFDSATTETQRRLTALKEAIQRYAADHGGSAPNLTIAPSLADPLDLLVAAGTTCNLNKIATGEAAGFVQGDCGPYFDRPAADTDTNAFKRDGWANSITIDTGTSTIRSCGKNKICNDSDDLVVSFAPSVNASAGASWLSIGSGLQVNGNQILVVLDTINPNKPTDQVNTHWMTIRANRPISKGRYYWEFTWDQGGNSSSDANADDYFAIGVATAGTPAGALTSSSLVEFMLGQDAESWAYYPGLAQRINNNSVTPNVGLGLPIPLNTVIGVALDMDNGYIGWQAKKPADGSCSATSLQAFNNLAGKVVYPAVSLKAAGSPDTRLTSKFKATPSAFTCTPPLGYVSLD